MDSTFLTNILCWAAFIGIFVTVAKALVADWTKLHQDYPASARPNGQRWRSASAHIGGTHYSFSLCVVYAREGLYLNAGWLGRLFLHQPILIPWSAINYITTPEEQLKNRVHMSVRTSKAPVDVILYDELAVALEEHRKMRQKPIGR